MFFLFRNYVLLLQAILKIIEIKLVCYWAKNTQLDGAYLITWTDTNTYMHN